MGNDQSVRQEPLSLGSDGSSQAMSKPIKSAMTRSTFMRSHPLASGGGLPGGPAEEKERKIRYLPNGLDRAHNGLIMPTRPVGMGVHGGDPHGNGIESPQWGWYINTTPPTPEMYHSRSSLKHRGTDKSDYSTSSSATSALSSDVTAYRNAAMRGPNRVFQGLKAGSNRPPVGWPNVPL